MPPQHAQAARCAHARLDDALDITQSGRRARLQRAHAPRRPCPCTVLAPQRRNCTPPGAMYGLEAKPHPSQPARDTLRPRMAHSDEGGARARRHDARGAGRARLPAPSSDALAAWLTPQGLLLAPMASKIGRETTESRQGGRATLHEGPGSRQGVGRDPGTAGEALARGHDSAPLRRAHPHDRYHRPRGACHVHLEGSSAL